MAFEKSTRSGDYLIREKIREINEELKSYDDKLKICDFDLKADFPIYEEILPFFEERYLDSFILNERIALLKQEITNQNNTDIKHNTDYPEENYKRNINNPYREELKKDLKVFEAALIKIIIPYLNEFLSDINDLFFINSLNKSIDELSIKKNFEEPEIILNNKIISFININYKIKKTGYSLEEITALTNVLLNETGIKSRLLRLKNIDEQKLDNIIIHCGNEYLSRRIISDSALRKTNKDQINIQKDTQQIIQNNFNNVMHNLRLLTENKITLIKTGNTIDGKLSINRDNRYLYSSPESGKTLLKDIADYLSDSLIFLIEWL